MGTRNFTSVIIGGKQVVCQYCQWDGYPTSAGADILKFLKDVDMVRFQEALRNTRIVTAPYDECHTYTGSSKDTGHLFDRVDTAREALNKAWHESDGRFYSTYETVENMLENGALSVQEADDFIAASRDIGFHILSYIYGRSVELPPLELCAIDEEYTEIQDFALNPEFNGVPGCDAQGYYIIDLDSNVFRMNYNEFPCEFSLDALPENVDREMMVLELAIEKLQYSYRGNYDYLDADAAATAFMEDAENLALSVGVDMQTDHPELMLEGEEVTAEAFGRDYIYRQLMREYEHKQKEKGLVVGDVLEDAGAVCENASMSSGDKSDVDIIL